MRILIPIHAFPPSSRYGAELYAFYLSRELQNSGACVHVLHSDRGEVGVGGRSYAGIECTIVGRPAAAGPVWLDRPSELAEAAFRSLLVQFRPDVVHFNHLLHLSTRLPRLAQDAGCRVLYTLHDYWIRCPKVKLLDWWGGRCEGAPAWRCASCCRARYSRMTWPSQKLSREGGPSGRIARDFLKEMCFQIAERPSAWRRIRKREAEMRAAVAAVDRFIAPTRFVGRLMIDWGIPADRIVHCDYGTMELPYARRIEGQRRRPLFGFIGGINREKGLHVLLEAFRGQKDADLVVYGGDRASLIAAFGELADMPNVRFGGVIDDEQKALLLPQLDALVVPSIWYENSPLVIHEAFQAGVPVICSDIGGMAELVTDGLDGLHFRVGQPDDLLRVLHRCVREDGLIAGLREGVRKPLGMREHVRDEILPIYESLCGRGLATTTGPRR